MTAPSAFLSLASTKNLPEIFAQSYLNRETSITPSSLGPLSTVNIFIGANNSGKSRLLRGLAAIQEPELVDVHASDTLKAWACKLRILTIPDQVYLVPVGAAQGNIPKKQLNNTAQRLAAVMEKLAQQIELLPHVLKLMPQRQAHLWMPDGGTSANVRGILLPFLDDAFSDFKKFPLSGPEPRGFDDFLDSPLWLILETARHQDMHFTPMIKPA